jgi:hypothetical protein
VGELSLQALEARADALVDAVELDPADLTAYADDARALGPSLDDAGLSRLMNAFVRVQGRIASERDQLRERLDHAGCGKKALRGYGSLRPVARMCQRASSLA